MVRALVTGLVAGILLSAVLLAWRWLRGRPVFPKQTMKVHELPIRFWIMAILLLGGMSVGAFLTQFPSFSVAFGAAALGYAWGLVYTVRRRGPGRAGGST